MRRIVGWLLGSVLLSAVGAAHGACTFGTSFGGEPSLQGVFDSILGPGSLSATNDCVDAAQDQVWTPTGDVVATIIVEIAGYAAQNVFGIYDPLSPTTNQVSVFSGSAAPGATATIELTSNGSMYDVWINGAYQAQFNGRDIGFFLRTPANDTFFSQASLNVDGADHLMSYRGNGDTFVGGPLIGSSFTEAMYLLAFEDLRIPDGDEDYQDFVAVATNVVPVPLPGALLLLGSVLCLGALKRRIGAL